MTTLLAFLFVLGVLVFVHELGHFLVARHHGVRVLTFSLGFGPKLLQTKRGDTVYCVSAIPLGGYVKMAGETVEDKREGRPDEFLSKTKWQRFQVLLAGPAMNVVLAVVVMAFVLLVHGAEVPLYEEEPPVIGSVIGDSPAEAAGILPGDRILTVAGRPVDTWADLQLAVADRADREVEVALRRDGEVRRLSVTPARGRYNLGDLGVLPDVPSQVAAWSSQATAARDAGLEIGDVIEEVDGRRVTTQTLVEAINASAGAPVTLQIRREGVAQEITLAAEPVGDGWMIGIAPRPFLEVRVVEAGLFEAFALSVERNLEWSQLIFQTLGRLLTRDTPMSQLVGPVGIAQLSGDAAATGWVPLFTLMAMISLNLGILNLLPIPILDGGHILVLAMEGIARRDFSVQLKERMLLAGFVVLMTLMVTVIYNDLTRVAWIERLMIWR